MKVHVKEAGGHNIFIWLPSGLVFNRLSAAMLPGILKQNGIDITREQAVEMVKTVNQCRRRFRDWNLVEVQDSNGDFVVVKL